METAQIKMWCFTDWDSINHDIIMGSSNIEYFIYGKEVCPETGRLHNQGFVSFFKKQRLSACKKLLNKKTHWESKSQYSTIAQAADYCKKDKEYWEWGSLPINQQGKRTDIEKAVDTMRELGFNKAVLAHPNISMKYAGGMKLIKSCLDSEFNDTETPRNWVTEVYILSGPPGSGKTKRAHELTESSGDENIIYWDGKYMFDYVNQEGVIFDDFDWTCMRNEMLMQITDRYAMSVRVLYGSRRWNPKRIVFTTNQEESYIWQKFPALQRRCTSFEYIALP